MAVSNWKVYNPEGDHVAYCKYAEDAAALVAFYGNGASISHSSASAKLWREGKESQPASESFDHVACIVHDRLRARQLARHAKTYTQGAAS